MSRIGRNDPCPCGSGKKYKRCCLGKDDAAATVIPEVDAIVTGGVLEWLTDRHGDRVKEAASLLAPQLWEKGEDGETRLLLMHLVAWETPAENGEPLSPQFPETLRRRLDPREQDWLAELQRSRFSLWDVIEVRKDEGLFLRDLFTGEERFVREASATRGLPERSILLARVARFGDVWTLAAIHPQVLPPREADFVSDEARQALKLGRGRVDPARLRGEAAFRLVDLWDAVAEDRDAAPRPELRNTDGDPLLRTEDSFSFDAADRKAVLARLRGIPELEEEDDDEPGLQSKTFALLADGGDDEEPRLHLARIEVGDLSVVIETNSTRRADATRARIEPHLSGVAKFVDRCESDYQHAIDAHADRKDDLRGAGDAGEDEIPSDVAAG